MINGAFYPDVSTEVVVKKQFYHGFFELDFQQLFVPHVSFTYDHIIFLGQPSCFHHLFGYNLYIVVILKVNIPSHLQKSTPSCIIWYWYFMTPKKPPKKTT